MKEAYPKRFACTILWMVLSQECSVIFWAASHPGMLLEELPHDIVFLSMTCGVLWDFLFKMEQKKKKPPSLLGLKGETAGCLQVGKPRGQSVH